MNGKTHRTLRRLHVRALSKTPPSHPSDTVHRSSTDSAERPTPNLQQRSQAGAIESPNVQKYASAATAQCAIGMTGLAAIGAHWTSPRHLNKHFMYFSNSLKETEFHHASSSSSPRVLRKIIPASSDENRGQALLLNTELTLLTSFGGDCPKHHAWR